MEEVVGMMEGNAGVESVLMIFNEKNRNGIGWWGGWRDVTGEAGCLGGWGVVAVFFNFYSYFFK